MPKEQEAKNPGKDDRDRDDKVVLKVDMHCQGCKEKVRKSLAAIQGLEKIDIDMNAQRVTVKGKVDAKELLETVRKKSGRRTELLFPQLSKEVGNKEQKKAEEDVAIDSIIKTIDSITDLLLNQWDLTVVLRVKMHCRGCAKQVQKALAKMEGVYDVKADFEGEKVTVKGKNIESMEVCEWVRKKTGKHAALISSQRKDETKQEKKEAVLEKKEKTKDGDKKKEEEQNSQKKEEKQNSQKKEEKQNSQKKEEKNKEEGNSQKKEEKKKQDDSQKKEEKEKERGQKKVEGNEESTQKAAGKEKKEDGKEEEENRNEIKKSQHISAMSAPEYVYPPEMFSDENPNACIIM